MSFGYAHLLVVYMYMLPIKFHQIPSSGSSEIGQTRMLTYKTMRNKKRGHNSVKNIQTFGFAHLLLVYKLPIQFHDRPTDTVTPIYPTKTLFFGGIIRIIGDKISKKADSLVTDTKKKR